MEPRPDVKATATNSSSNRTYPHPPAAAPSSSNSTNVNTMKALSYLIPFSLSWKKKNKGVIQDESPVKIDLRSAPTHDIVSPEIDRYQMYTLSPQQRQRLRPSEGQVNPNSPPKLGRAESFNDRNRTPTKPTAPPTLSSPPQTSSYTNETSPLPRQRSNNKLGVLPASSTILKHPRSGVSSGKVASSISPQKFHHDEDTEWASNGASKATAAPLISSSAHSTAPTQSGSSVAPMSSGLRRKLQQVAIASEEYQVSPSRASSQRGIQDVSLNVYHHRESDTTNAVGKTAAIPSVLSAGTAATGTSKFTSSLLSRFSNVSKTAAAMADSTSPNDDGITGTASSSSEDATPTAAPAASKPPCCDKCDGKHETDDCPYYKKKRDDHPDAQRKNGRQIGGTSLLPGGFITNARVIRQPGDGSCLFHSLSFGLGGGYSATRLRSEICSFIQANPQLLISETPLKDWVKWDSGTSVSDYIRKMSRGSWGGGIEMACLSQMKQVNVHVYERSGIGYKRISAFDVPVNTESRPIIRVLYCGGVHYGTCCHPSVDDGHCSLITFHSDTFIYRCPVSVILQQINVCTYIWLDFSMRARA